MMIKVNKDLGSISKNFSDCFVACVSKKERNERENECQKKFLSQFSFKFCLLKLPICQEIKKSRNSSILDCKYISFNILLKVFSGLENNVRIAIFMTKILLFVAKFDIFMISIKMVVCCF